MKTPNWAPILSHLLFPQVKHLNVHDLIKKVSGLKGLKKGQKWCNKKTFYWNCVNCLFFKVKGWIKKGLRKRYSNKWNLMQNKEKDPVLCLLLGFVWGTSILFRIFKDIRLFRACYTTNRNDMRRFFTVQPNSARSLAGKSIAILFRSKWKDYSQGQRTQL